MLYSETNKLIPRTSHNSIKTLILTKKMRRRRMMSLRNWLLLKGYRKMDEK